MDGSESSEFPDSELEAYQRARRIEINNTNFTHLPAVSPELEIFDCAYNKLQVLPELPDELFELKCSNNVLNELPELPLHLNKLHCDDNNITQLPELPNSLIQLYCSYNKLENIPELPNRLQQFTCSNNVLKKLPPLPNSLLLLKCSDNQLETLNIQNVYNLIHTLHCENNKLSKLPRMPNLLSIDCYNNNLTKFPKFPDRMNEIMIANNPFLKNPVELKKFKAYLKRNPQCNSDYVPIEKKNKYRTLNAREPRGQAKSFTRRLYRNLPRKPVINTENLIHEERMFKPQHWGTRYRGRDRTNENRQSRRMRRRGIYPQARYRYANNNNGISFRSMGVNPLRSSSPPRVRSQRITPIVSNRGPIREDILYNSWQQLQEELREQYEEQLRQQYQQQNPFFDYPRVYNSENNNSQNYYSEYNSENNSENNSGNY